MGAGAGIAPFRGFWEDLRRGPQVAPDAWSIGIPEFVLVVAVAVAIAATAPGAAFTLFCSNLVRGQKFELGFSFTVLEPFTLCRVYVGKVLVFAQAALFFGCRHPEQDLSF